MCKEKIFEDAILVVCEVTGIGRTELLNSRTEEATDARCLLVRYLCKLMSCVSIGKLIGRTRQGVRSLVQRQKGDTWLMTRNWAEIVKQMESKGYGSK